MAYASITSQYTHIAMYLNSLQYDASNYGDIKFRLMKYNGTTEEWDVVDEANSTGASFAGGNSVWHTFTGQEPGAYYYPAIWIKYGGTWYPDDPSVGYGYTANYIQPDMLPPPTISNESRTQSSITFTAVAGYGARVTYVYCSLNGTNYAWYNISNINGQHIYNMDGGYFEFSFTTNGNSITINWLAPNELCLIACYSYYEGWYSWSADNGEGYLSYSTLALDVVHNPTIDTIYSEGFGLSWTSTGAPFYYIRAIKSGGSYIYWLTSNNYVTIGGLEANTTYDISVMPAYIDDHGVYFYGNDNYSTVTTGTTSSGRPSNFAWTTPIAQGNNINSIDLANKILYVITATEWNAFTAKINAFRAYKGLSAYSFTTVSRGTNITKAIINEARTAINDIGDRTVYTPAARATGDIINEAYPYLQLRDALNSTT